jgi:transposase
LIPAVRRRHPLCTRRRSDRRTTGVSRTDADGGSRPVRAGREEFRDREGLTGQCAVGATVASWLARGRRGRVAVDRPGVTTAPGPAADDHARGAVAHGRQDQRWTLLRIRAVIERRFGIVLSVHAVWELLRRHGWSCEQPVRRATERDDQAVRRWVREVWPRFRSASSRIRTCAHGSGGRSSFPSFRRSEGLVTFRHALCATNTPLAPDSNLKVCQVF